MHYITRMDYARNHGWWVRITAVNRKPGDPRLVASKVFSDGKWGGKRKALAIAKAWRDKALAKYPRPPEHRTDRGVVKPGYGYVRFAMLSRYSRKLGRGEGLYPTWVGWLRVEDGAAIESRASADRWGGAVARRRVEAWLEAERRALADRLGITYGALLKRAGPVLPGYGDRRRR